MTSVVDSNANQANDTTTVSVSITPSGNNRAVYAAVYAFGDVTPSMTCSGNSMGSPIASLLDNAEVGRWSLFRYLAPAASAQNVVATVGAENILLKVIAVAADEVDQTTPNRTPATGPFGDGVAASVNVTSQAGDLVLDFITGFIGAASLTPGANQTAVETHDPEPGGEIMAASRETATGTSTTMSWAALTGQTTSIALALIPASGGGGGHSLIKRDRNMSGGMRDMRGGMSG